MRLRLLPALTALLLLACPPAAAQAPTTYRAGVAKVDITPSYPVRLSGFGFRRAESEGVTQRIWAKALALHNEGGEPAVLLTVDNLGIPARLVEEVARRLAKKAGLKRERPAITATHTHTAPMLTGVAPTLFGQPIPKEHQAHIDRYTAELTDALEKAALAALADRQPARLSYGIGTVTFAVNRRTRGGPVDHDLPVLVVRDLKGKVRAVYVTYACHCVTLSNNKVSGDWAGFAQEQIEDDHPGAVALVSVGCGADSNPSSGVTGDKVDVARSQGAALAREVRRLVKGRLTPVTGTLRTAARQIELPLDTPPTRAQWEEKAKRTDAIGYHARVQLARLDRGEKLRTKIDYPVQAWTFGDSLALVFLPGEVVVDYALRLKRELDGLRLWINAYANDAPCYIPSERVLKEGGYEGGGAMVYYDVPARLAPGLEQKIVDTVRALVGPRFKSPFDAKRTATRPLSPQQSLAALRVREGLRAELVVAEPLVVDPVAIAFGPDGKLWVAEMLDYPAGKGGDYKPGGRIRLLESTGGDGQYDRATVFLDNIPFPTGVTVWRKGVLVCAAPDILYAEDTDGDGKADVVRKVYSGFGTGNYQARVNSLEYGLDGWVYGSCGGFGGRIQGFPLKVGAAKPAPVELGNRDFRCKPDLGLIEPATGRTQQGRVRDDWGNWFGCDNSTLCRHYPLADHYLRRNPHVAPPAAGVLVPSGPDPNRLYPIQKDLQLFKLSGPPGRTTAACGLGINRDNLLGKEYAGNAFVCEPVNLLVHRMVLSPRGSTFVSHRAKGEETSEFLASTDTWFRPVQVRTGPDGALWVVDMYRYVIEHPRWIPPAELAKVDLRAGSTMGRIYRIVPKDGKPRTPPRLDKLDTAGLVAALDSPNGWQRDMAAQMLLWRGDRAATEALRRLAADSPRAEARLHALCVLDGLGGLTARTVLQGLRDPSAGVRRHAVRLSERFLADSPEVGSALLPLTKDADAQVQLQLVYSLGEWRDARAGRALAELALQPDADAYLSAAVLSSVRRENLGDVLTGVFAGGADRPPPERLVERLLSSAAALGDSQAFARSLKKVSTPREGRLASWQLAALAGALEALQRRGQSLEQVADSGLRDQVRAALAQARTTAADVRASEAERLSAVRVLGRDAAGRDADLAVLGKLLSPRHAPALQSAAAAALGRIPDERVAATLSAGWKGYTPALRPQVLDLLLSRAAWQRHLLGAIEKRVIPAAHLDAGRRQRLLAHKDAQVRARAAQVFAGAADADRRKVLDAYRAALKQAGDRARGKVVFVKNCAACHRLHGDGHAVGPDLAALANKSSEYLLTEILDPNRNVDTRYIEYVATTSDGRTFTGMLASETATGIVLRGQEGREQPLLRNELEALHSLGKSLMPEGLEKTISQQEMADLLAYLTAPAASAQPQAAPQGETTMNTDLDLRVHLLDLLRGGGAHLHFDAAIADLPFALRGARPPGIPHTPWRLLEHMRIAQWDILEFSRNPKHVSPAFPAGYWPEGDAPPDDDAWESSVAAFRAGLKAMQDLVANPKTDLFARIPHGDGQTILREALLLADHNAYHLGQLVVVRRALSAWSE
jgi:putative membrane-bound dehydrogenase-like protein